MKLDMNDLETLARDLALEMGEGCERQRLNGHKQVFLNLISSPRKVHWKGWVASLAALSAVGAALICLWVFVPSNGSLPFEVGTDKVFGTEGQWLEATQEQSLPVLFADKSSLSLQGSSRARVVASTKRSVQVFLEEGNLTANVVNNGTRRWTFLAGPFEIRDLGTRFSVQWQRSSAELEVVVWEGRVQINGPSLGEAGVVVSANEKFWIDSYGQTMFSKLNSPEDSSSESAEQDVPEVNSDAESNKQALPDTAPPSAEGRFHSASANKKQPYRRFRVHHENSRSAKVREPNPLSAGSDRQLGYNISSLVSVMKSMPEEWQTLFEQGRYNEFMALVKKSGLEQWLGALDLPDLWRLAEAARYAKQNADASQALLAVRHRFPSTWHARVAAYLLGRLAMQRTQDLEFALKWLTTYLHEDPDGSLAEEALGQLISVYQHLGRNQEAQETAKAYLQHYPGGMFTFLAKSVIK
jgi:transmembrane sensor